MTFKRIISILLSMVMLFSLMACTTTPAKTDPPAKTDAPVETAAPVETEEPTETDGQSYTAGTYTAETSGRNGKMVISVTVDETSITAVEVTEHVETATLCDTPLTQIPAQIVKYQSLDVDAITGATLTSYAVIRGAEEALKEAGADINALNQPVEKEKVVYGETDTEIVVVGAGSAGMTAAIRAAEAGAKVLLVEKQGFLGGGDSMFSSTSLRAGGSSLQTGEGESTEDFYKYLEAQAMEYRPDVCDLEAVRIYAERSGRITDWLIELGVPYGTVTKSSFSVITEDGSAPGSHNMRVLANRVEELGIEYRVDTTATAILMDDGAAVGITVKDPNGTYNINASAVIVCTGGYSNNLDLVGKYAPDWLNRPTTGAPSCTGDGILMAEAIGAKITNMDQVKANALCYELGGVGISLTAITPYAVLINRDGMRFMNESGGTVISRAEGVMKQPENEAYAVFDETVIEKLKLMKGYNDSGYFLSADSIEELAELLENTDKEAFIATMNAYIESSKEGYDADFDKEIVNPIGKPKYYAVRVTPSMQSTYGGITTDHSARVLDVNDNIIPGLYAAGATSGHGCCAGEVGAALIVAFAFGEIAGETAAAELQK